MDFYEILGVAKDATKQQIHAAYREKAKTAHPDVPGGDAQTFNTLRLAREVLSRPEWRRAYDESGKIPADEADNETAHLVTVLTSLFGQTFQGALQAKVEPWSRDFVGAMKVQLEDGLKNTLAQIPQMEEGLSRLNKMKHRFLLKTLDNPNFLENIVNSQHDALATQIASARNTVRQLEMCRVYLSDVVFNFGEMAQIEA